jgi:lipopolysaccharide transport system ATP-binding protein
MAAREAGAAFVFASHDLNAVRRICDRALWLDAGKVAAVGSAEDVVASYEEVASAAAMRRLMRRLPSDEGSAWGRVEAVELRYGGSVLDSISVLEPAGLAVSFRAAASGLRARCIIDVFARGVLAFRTVQTEEVAIEATGPWRARVHIPPHMLAPTVYTVSAFVVLRLEGEERVCAAENALTFRVYGSAAEESPGPGFSSHSPGVIGPHLEWRVEEGQDDGRG